MSEITTMSYQLAQTLKYNFEKVGNDTVVVHTEYTTTQMARIAPVSTIMTSRLAGPFKSVLLTCRPIPLVREQ